MNVDIPIIISGETIAFNDPQSLIWKDEDGRPETGGKYNIARLIDTDHLRPLDGIDDFNPKRECHGKTLFRFPLRTKPSSLSSKCYDISKVYNLINAFREEAKYLLLFLQSLHTIEVYNIDEEGKQTLTFQATLDEVVVDGKQIPAKPMEKKRTKFITDSQELKSSQTALLDVSIRDPPHAQTSTSKWLVSNHFDSSDVKVRDDAKELMLLPRVGTALDLKNPGDGRIFCFLPMPIETASNLPVHVNGTFCVSDDRRSLIWPGDDRKNDDRANWNATLIERVIPSCYVTLLLEAKKHLKKEDFYKAWPDVNAVKDPRWKPLLDKVFELLMGHEVIYSEPFQHPGEWVKPGNVVTAPPDVNLKPVMNEVLTNCGVKVAEVPSAVREAFKKPLTGTSPELIRRYMRENPGSYDATIDHHNGIHVLLTYCLSDAKHNDLIGLKLLPLCNGNCLPFSKATPSSPVYLCTKDCPRDILPDNPNVDCELVGLQSDHDLQGLLTKLAESNSTQLKTLTVPDIPRLLEKSMQKGLNLEPASLRKWLQRFWSWVQNKPLQPFKDNLILPVLDACAKGGSMTPQGKFSLVELSTQPVIYIPTHITCSNLSLALSVLSKFGTHCCIQELIVEHKELSKFTYAFSSDGIVKAFSCLAEHDKVILTEEEASCFRKHLHDESTNISPEFRSILRSLKIFTSASNSQRKLYSINQVCQESLLQTCVTLESVPFNISVLPDNIVVFTTGGDLYHQTKLLKEIADDSFMRGVSFIMTHLLPHIGKGNIPEHYIDRIMVEVLDKLKFLGEHIPDKIRDLQFLTPSSGGGARKCPKDLYDPENAELRQIFYTKRSNSENVDKNHTHTTTKSEPDFPSAFYDKWLPALRTCGLRDSIQPQVILDTIFSISLQSSQSVDCQKFTCAKAILKYIGTKEFESHSHITCSLPKDMNTSSLPFAEALSLLSKKRCWLPIQSSRPSGYPLQLPWKGEDSPNHLCNLKSNVFVSSVHNEPKPLAYGSQVYFTDPVIETTILLPNVSPSHLVTHLQSVVDNFAPGHQEETSMTVKNIYSEMQDTVQHGNSVDLASLKSMEKWIYIKGLDRFISPSAVAISLNQSFHHNLEPYLHKLPDSLSSYSELFTKFDVSKELSPSQIISVLPTMRDEIASGSKVISAEKCWEDVRAILNWLTNYGTTTYQGSLDAVYVPIKSDLKDWPDLQPANEVVYADNVLFEWFDFHSITEKPLMILHSEIELSIAEHLKLITLSEKLGLSGDILFEDTGQNEDLISRLKSIQQEYQGELTIIKELIQNADDAQATEIKICFDARTHCKDKTKLIFPGMSGAHGPALVIYNNRTFSDDDFKNITKIAGATKKEKQQMIGKFGIGFCSVYHITDVPSFVSREWLYIFDPTLQCLEKEVNNRSQPGKRLRFTHQFIQKSKQMDPYNMYGFGCNKFFDSTLFRLPFRTSVSELSNKCHPDFEKTSAKLLDDIRTCGESLVLFLQHVQTISYQQIDNDEVEPKTLFRIDSKKVQLPQKIDEEAITCYSVDVTDGEKSRSTQWLVSRYTTCRKQKYAVSSVACELKTTNTPDVYTVNEKLEGEVFCFLPLSLSTGLPFHVNCNFAINSNRRGIWTASGEDTSDFNAEVEWNHFLMKEVIPMAYNELICCLKTMFESDILQDYAFCSMWPLDSMLRQKNPWERCVKAINLLLANQKLFYSTFSSKWLSLKECRFLDPDILGQPGYLPCVQDILNHLAIPLVDLPGTHRSHFNLTCQRLPEEEFIELFYTNLSQLNDTKPSRNKAILYILEAYGFQYGKKSELVNRLTMKFKSLPCIPCAPDGELKKCSEVVDPTASFANLFFEADERFPLQILSEKQLAMTALRHAGMVYKSLSWDLVIDRAQSVEHLMSTNRLKALERVKIILKTISTCTSDGQPLHNVKFLPVMKKPGDYPLPWYGDGHNLLPGKKLVMSDSRSKDMHLRIAGSQVAFLCENPPESGGCGQITDPKTQHLLHLRTSPSLHEVIEHLKEVIDHFNSLSSPSQSECDWITKTCKHIYQFIEDSLDKSEDAAREAEYLKTMSCIWNGKQFMGLDKVACMGDFGNGPYLYNVPSYVSSKEKLCSFLHLKEHFNYKDALDALKMMQSDLGDKPITEEFLTGTCTIFMKASEEDLKKARDSDVYLPDNNNVLRKSSDLVHNDVSWKSVKCKKKTLSEMFSRKLSVALGVELLSSTLLEKYLITDKKDFRGVAFGQHEEVTRRIQNIIRDYPFNMTLLKELLQNADDARAKMMYVILDKRTHGKDSVLSEEWKKLQGPALLVWNDSVFEEKDLKGIQQLGLGSKRNEAESIGQFGIGFNVVYHLTDCPSFITGSETLCVLDPHCKYVPEAEEKLPGARYNLKGDSGFWQDFPDMCSAYLQDIATIGKDGSLFRFPLRHTENLVKDSQIVDPAKREPLRVEDLSKHMHDWMPKMKQAMFFLNHVTDIRYMEIVETSEGVNMQTKFHFETKISDPTKFQDLQSAISKCSDPGNCQPCVIDYSLTLTEFVCEPSKHTEKNVEKWIIQQGVGDLKKEDQYWQYVQMVKPRHGIAAPLQSQSNKDAKSLFCFLPLPKESGVPVHINGAFALDSNRRSLWKSPSGEDDDKNRWNQRIYKAIASSYARFLEKATSHYLKSSYKDRTLALVDLKRYYLLFPDFPVADINKKWGSLSCEVYKNLLESNAKVLCVLMSQGAKVSVEWHPLMAAPANRVHVWPHNTDIDVDPILQSIGMKVTPAEPRIIECINKIKEKLAKEPGGCSISREHSESKIRSVTPDSVFEYYTNCYSAKQREMPKAISETDFKTEATFKHFIEYLTESNKLPSLFSHFLLLTADGFLRKFDDKSKVFNSKYSHLFPEHRHQFLHPTLTALKLDSYYFIEPNSDRNSQRVSSVFEKTLRKELHKVKCVANADLVTKEELKSYWKCLDEDKVFKFYRDSVLKEWALLLTTDGFLYSSASDVMPSYQLSESDDLIQRVRNIMDKLEMRFLDSDVVPTGVTKCPILANKDMILSNFFHTEKIASKLTDQSDIATLMQYFKKDAKQIHSDWVEQISSMPFFMDVTGKYLPITGKTAYIWPEGVPSEGYDHWNTNSLVFVQSNGSWTKLGSSQQFSIHKITAEALYTNHIFPKFGKLKEEEQHSHLDNIRSHLFAKNRDMSMSSRTSKVAQEFICALKDLKCLSGKEASELKSVSGFCDHTEGIFNVFSSHFQPLPEKWKDDKWLSFFRDLGLQRVLTTDKYLFLCKETAKGGENAGRYSDALLQYLFSDSMEIRETWYSNKAFLTKVKDIPFVHCADTSPVKWLLPGASKMNQLVKLNGAASKDLMELLWTVKPIIALPSMCMNKLTMKDEKVISLLGALGVTYKAKSSNVLRNVTTICKESRYSHESLFSNYPDDLLPPAVEADQSPKQSLLDVMFKNLKFFSDNGYKDAAESLTELACIPVFCNLPKKDVENEKVMLVQPSRVLMSSQPASVQKYHPILHSLPSKLFSLSPVLTPLGVSSTLQVHHMQIVLKKIKDKKCADPDTAVYIKKAILHLNGHLKSAIEVDGESTTVSDLTPLYLPDTSGTLQKSTTMLYRDSPSFYGKMEINFTGTCYSHFDITLNSHGVSASAFCQLLPKAVRPQRMSKLCRQVPDTDCKTITHSTLSNKVQKSLQSDSNISDIARVYKTKIPCDRDLEKTLSTYLSHFVVVTKYKLRMQIELKESGKVIGQKASEYYLDSSARDPKLFIDNELEDEEDVFKEIAELLHVEIAGNITSIIPRDLKDALRTFIAKYLRGTTSQKQKLLAQFDVDFKYAYDPNFRLELGKEIPESYHHLLDQDLHTVYTPMQYVGYEDKENHFIVAQVVHLVDSGKSANRFCNVYHINTDKKDEDGKNASVLEIYKFTETAFKKGAKGSDSALKEYIRKDLREILELDEELRLKAVRRRNLKWHSDQKLVSTEKDQEVYKQLLEEEISDLQRGKQQVTKAGTAKPVVEVTIDYTSLSDAARSHRKARASEETFVEENPKACPTHFDAVTNQRKPKEGKVWVDQAGIDYTFLHAIISMDSIKCYGHICFMAHQVAEKALKGCVYALCGMDGRIEKLLDHNLTRHALALETAVPDKTKGLSEHAATLENFYLDTRYPHRWPGKGTPSSHYDKEQAQEAKDHAKAVLDIVKSIMPN